MAFQGVNRARDQPDVQGNSHERLKGGHVEFSIGIAGLSRKALVRLDF